MSIDEISKRNGFSVVWGLRGGLSGLCLQDRKNHRDFVPIDGSKYKSNGVCEK